MVGKGLGEIKLLAEAVLVSAGASFGSASVAGQCSSTKKGKIYVASRNPWSGAVHRPVANVVQYRFRRDPTLSRGLAYVSTRYTYDLYMFIYTYIHMYMRVNICTQTSRKRD